MPTLTLRKRKPKKAPSPKSASDTAAAVTPVRPRPKPKSKKAPVLDGEAVVGVAPQDSNELENGTSGFKLRIAAETLASLKHTVPNPDASNVTQAPTSCNLEIDDIYVSEELPWNTFVDNSGKSEEDGEDSEESQETSGEEEVDELIDELSDNLNGLKENGEITL
jgi:hypothetical protein